MAVWARALVWCLGLSTLCGGAAGGRLGFHHIATRSAYDRFYWPDNHLRHRNAMFIHCGLCSSDEQQVFHRWAHAEEDPSHRHFVRVLLPSLFASNTSRPPCTVLWLGTSPAAVYAEALFLLHTTSQCPSAAFVTANPAEGWSGLAARYHVTAAADELCGVQLGTAAFRLVVLDTRRGAGYAGRRASAAALGCVLRSLAPDAEVLVYGPAPLPASLAASLALQTAGTNLPGINATQCPAAPANRTRPPPCVRRYRRGGRLTQPQPRPRATTTAQPLPRPNVSVAALRLAAALRCGACTDGHRSAGQAYLGKAAKVFGQAQDRQVLERDILPAVRSAGLRLVLFPGVQPYTQKYVHFFLRNGSTVLATVEMNPRGAIYGAEPHYQATIAALPQLVAAASFDGLVAHGVLGHGLDEEKDVREFFGVAAALLKPGGWLNIGYHLNPHAPRSKPRAQSHGFAPGAFGPLLRKFGFEMAAFQHLPPQNCFRNVVSSVPRSTKFCSEFWQKRPAS